MKCPKCGYASFPYLESCRKCGQGFADPRVFFGVYALPPNPPDLMSAYETSQTDTVSTPEVAFERLEEIDNHLVAGVDTARSRQEDPPYTDATLEISPISDLDPELPRPLSPTPPEMDQTDDKEPITIDLSDLEGFTLELREVTEEEAATAMEIITPPGRSAADDETIFEVDLEDDVGLLPREPAAEPADPNEDDETAVEYVLEIDEVLELEVDELEREDPDEDEDDTNR